jgi:hypothetical protein
MADAPNDDALGHPPANDHNDDALGHPPANNYNPIMPA